MKIRTLPVFLFLMVAVLFSPLVAGAEECPRNEEYEKARSVAIISVWQVLSLEREKKGGNLVFVNLIIRDFADRRVVLLLTRSTAVLEEIVAGDRVKFELIRNEYFGDGITNQEGQSGYLSAECITEQRIPSASFVKKYRAGDYLLLTERIKNP